MKSKQENQTPTIKIIQKTSIYTCRTRRRRYERREPRKETPSKHQTIKQVPYWIIVKNTQLNIHIYIYVCMYVSRDLIQLKDKKSKSPEARTNHRTNQNQHWIEKKISIDKILFFKDL